MYCEKCGHALGNDRKFCSQCGLPRLERNSEPHRQSTSSSPNSSSWIVLIAIVIAAIWAVNLHEFSAFIAVFVVLFVTLSILFSWFSVRHRLAGAIAGILLVFLINAIEGWDEQRETAKKAQLANEKAAADAQLKRKEDEAFARIPASEHLQKAQALLHPGANNPDIMEGYRHLAAIERSAPEKYAADRLKSNFEAEQKRRAAEIARQNQIKNKQLAAQQAILNRAVRDAAAKTLENGLLDKGYNVDVVAIGKDHTTLRIKWILVSKALAHQLSEQSDFFENLRREGFKRVEITDGYEETWTWTL